MEDSVGWQPNHDWLQYTDRSGGEPDPGFSPGIYGDLAVEAAGYDSDKLSEEQKNLQEIAGQIAANRGYMAAEPLRFSGESLLPGSIHLGGNGTWIAQDRGVEQILEEEPDAVTYSTHNVDTIDEIYTFELILDMWEQGTRVYLGE